MSTRPATRTNRIDMIEPETYLTSHEAAGMIQANPSSINKWVKEGRIICFQTPGGHRRIKAADFVAFLSEHNMPVPEPLVAVATMLIKPTKPTKGKRR